MRSEVGTQNAETRRVHALLMLPCSILMVSHPIPSHPIPPAKKAKQYRMIRIFQKQHSLEPYLRSVITLPLINGT